MAEGDNAYTKTRVILSSAHQGKKYAQSIKKAKGKSKQIREAVIRTDEMEPSHGIRFKRE